MAVKVIEKSGFSIPKGIKATIKAGFFNSKYKNGVSVADVAFWNEFGTRTIPPRPFMRNVADNEVAMNKLFEIAKIEIGKSTSGDKIAEVLGEQLARLIKTEISSGEFTPNSPKTIARKKSSRPLIDTGLMLGAVSYRVEK